MYYMNKWRHFLNLGYDRQIIEKCRLALDEDNLSSIKNVSMVLVIILIIITSFYLFFDNQFIRNIICLISGFLVLGVYLRSNFLLKHKKQITHRRTDFLANALSALCFFVAIYLGTFAANGEMAVAPIWMFFFIVLILNRLPGQNLLVLFISGSIFAVCSFASKDGFVFRYDMMHAVTSILSSLYMSWAKTQLKVQNILALQKLENVNLKILETVEEQEKEAALLRHRAKRDELTGFYKKEAFEQEVNKIIENKQADKVHALICLDIDNFKNINDSMGHMFGDEVLKDLVSEIRSILGGSEMLGRFGGDEFVIFISDLSHTQDIKQMLEALINGCKKSYHSNDREITVSLSAGVAFYPCDSQSYKGLFEKADQALYNAKNLGKATFCIFKA